LEVERSGQADTSVGRKASCGSGPKCNERKLFHQPLTVTVTATIRPSEAPAEAVPNNRSNEPGSPFVALDDSDRLLFGEKTVRRLEMPQADGHFFAWTCLNIANPIRIRSKAIRNHDLRFFLAKLDDFQNGLTPQTAATADMSQQ
jgi:hypothetical protein